MPTRKQAAVQPSITSVYDDEYVTLYWQWSGVPDGVLKVSIGDPCNPGPVLKSFKPVL